MVASLVAFMTFFVASKSYVLNLSEALNTELKDDSISVSVLSPGLTKAELLDVSGQKLTSAQRIMMMESYPLAKKAIASLLDKEAYTLPDNFGNTQSITEKYSSQSCVWIY